MFPGKKIIWLIHKKFILWRLIQCTWMFTAALSHCYFVTLCYCKTLCQTVSMGLFICNTYIITNRPYTLICLWNHSLLFYQWVVWNTLCDSAVMNNWTSRSIEWVSKEWIFYWSTKYSSSLEIVYIHKVGLYQRFATFSTHLDQ